METDRPLATQAMRELGRPFAFESFWGAFQAAEQASPEPRETLLKRFTNIGVSEQTASKLADEITQK